MTGGPAPVRRFAVVTDSSADLTPAMALEHDVVVVPLTVTIDGETLADGVLSQQEFFRRMQAAPELATTSQPSVGAFVEAFGRALETAEEVVSVHISSKLSGTFEAARTAAEGFEGKVHVFDSRNLSWGLAFQVLDAAAAAREGLAVPDALERLAAVRDRVRIIVGLDTLEYLRRGGRINAATSFVGSLLSLKVIIAVDAEGAFRPMARSRGSRAAQRYMLDWVERQMGGAGSGRFAVGHALAADRAHDLADGIRERWGVTELVMYEAGPVILAHAGPIWGVTVLPDR